MPDHRGLFVLTESPKALPGNCGGCGKASCPGGFIDTGFDADFYGVLYYCYECVADMASKFGFITPNVAVSLKSKVAELEVESAQQRAAILGLESAVDGLQQARNSTNSNDIPIQHDSSPESPPEETTPEQTTEDIGSGIPKDAEPSINAGEPETDDVIEQPESLGIPSDNGLLDFAELGL